MIPETSKEYLGMSRASLPAVYSLFARDSIQLLAILMPPLSELFFSHAGRKYDSRASHGS